MTDRITIRAPRQSLSVNNVCCAGFRSKECHRVRGRCAAGCRYEEAAWERLAEYEDTGLSPEAVQDVANTSNHTQRALALLKATYHFIDTAGDQGSLAYLLGATVVYDDAECDVVCLRDDIYHLLNEMEEPV